MEKIGKDLAKLLVPEEVLKDFAIREVKQDAQGCYVIVLEEQEDLNHIPKTILHKGKAISNGFCNPIELQGFPVKGQALYLRLFRRRWRIRGTNQTASNDYSYNYPGMKTTKEFGDFLKGEGRN